MPQGLQAQAQGPNCDNGAPGRAGPGRGADASAGVNNMISHQRDPMSAGSGRDGFIIIAVLWMLIALATLASIYSVYIANTAMALAVSDDSLQAELLVTTSLELTAYGFSSSKDAQNPQGPGGLGVPGVRPRHPRRREKDAALPRRISAFAPGRPMSA